MKRCLKVRLLPRTLDLEKGNVTTMRFYTAGAASLAAAAILLVSAAPPASAQGQPTSVSASVTQTIALKHRKPSEIAALLAAATLPPSLEKSGRYARVKLTADDSKKTLTARGGKGEVALLQSLASSLDVAPQGVHLRVRLLRQMPVVGDAAEPAEADELASASVKTNSSTPADVTLFGASQAFQVNLTPRVLRDGSVAVEYHLAVRDAPRASVQLQHTFSGAGNVRFDKAPLRIGGNQLSQDTAAASTPAGVNYYLEITTVK